MNGTTVHGSEVPTACSPSFLCMAASSASSMPAALRFSALMWVTSASRWWNYIVGRSHDVSTKLPMPEKVRAGQGEVRTRGSRNFSINSFISAGLNMEWSSLTTLIKAMSSSRMSWMTLCSAASPEKSIFWFRKGKTMSSYIRHDKCLN